MERGNAMPSALERQLGMKAENGDEW